jgi:hypothetical protein
MVFADTGISDFRWKNRLLVVSGASKKLVQQLDSEEAGLTERDLQVFILSGEGKSDYPPKPNLAAEFAKRLSPDPEKPKVYLIGKDGQTTLEWSLDNFSFEKLYASIDAMPMRQREIREDR